MRKKDTYNNLGVTQSGVENVAWNHEVRGSNPLT